ncbi:hypothetical protein [Clostridium sardiniense]|uniref:hypothetical protein n=1 Tax=Clostridium sardiniense TaxID=29369 RepID=UPI00195C3903|nr:hypothetical protein [Clostridium sardiniense]MBM7836495.1 hypothetical protein [Clostridium sardiniense]
MNKFTGLAIRIIENKKPEEIINYHYAKEIESSKVALSSDLRVSKGHIADLEKLILFFKSKDDGKQVYVSADILDVLSSKEPFIPTELEEYIPIPYCKDKKHTWILIKNITIVNENELDDYIDKDGKPLVEALKSPRFPRLYFKEKSKDSINIENYSKNMPKLFK